VIKGATHTFLVKIAAERPKPITISGTINNYIKKGSIDSVNAIISLPL